MTVTGNEDKEEENIEKIKAVYDAARRRFEDERERTRRLDENARGLVTSTLVVIGFLLAAGTISRVDVETFFSRFYFLGITILVFSVICAYVAFQYKAGAVPKMMILPGEIGLDSKETAKEEYDYVNYRNYVDMARKVPFEEICKELAVSHLKIVNHNMEKNLDKGDLIYLSWTLMVIGLLMVTVFVFAFFFWTSDTTQDNQNATRTTTDGMRTEGGMLTLTVACPGNR